MTISESFKRFLYFNFETDFLENETLFQKTGVPFFSLKPLKLKPHHFHLKLLCQKPKLRQIERRLQNGPITKSGALSVTTLFFGKFVPVLEPLKRVNLMYQQPKCPNSYLSYMLKLIF